jgi:hypothetical protein
MPIDPVKIPQNVYIEDRVVGPLSLRQIIIMALGGGLSYMLYASWDKANGSVSIPVAVVLWMPAVIAAAFALVKINDLSLMRICFLLLEKANKPKIRTWTPRTGISINIRTAPKKEEPKKEEAKKQDTHSEIRSLSSMVDRGIPVAAIEQEKRIHDDVVDTVAASPAAPLQAAIAETQAAAASTQPSNLQTLKPEGSSVAMPQIDMTVFRDIHPPQAQ